jgi:hypothetical protein
MARLDERLADASAALASLDELVNQDELSLAERDGAFFGSFTPSKRYGELPPCFWRRQEAL